MLSKVHDGIERLREARQSGHVNLTLVAVDYLLSLPAIKSKKLAKDLLPGDCIFEMGQHFIVRNVEARSDRTWTELSHAGDGNILDIVWLSGAEATIHLMIGE